MNDFQGTYGRGMFLYSIIPSDDFVVGKSKSQIEQIKDFVTTGSCSKPQGQLSRFKETLVKKSLIKYNY